VSIATVNDAPVANNGNLNTSEDVAVNGLLSASDIDDDALIYSIVSNGGKGTAIITNTATGSYIYTPNPGATGTDSFTFRVNDGLVDSNSATITVNLEQVNDAPIADNGIIHTTEDEAANGVLSASDIDGDALIYSIVVNATKGVVVMTSTTNGDYTYTPNPDATGVDSFTFKVNDGQVDSSTATVSVSIAALNDAPVANNGNLSTDEDVAVNGALSASDVDGDALTYSIVANAGKGTAMITNAATGAYTYTPNPNATGVDSFTFKANDGLLNSSTATVSVSIAAVNDVPVANSGNLNTSEDVAAMGVLSASDADGNALVYSIVSNGSNGTALITNVDTGSYSYTPNPGATGSDSFTFKVNDGLVDSNAAAITVNLTQVNAAPIASSGILNIDEDVVASSVLSASDVDGDVLTYTMVTNGNNGTVVITNAVTGAYTYTPNQDATGVDSFTFKVNDGQFNSNTATVSVSIAAVNDVPVATNINFSIFNNETITGTLNAVDADGDTLTFSVVNYPSKGMLVLSDVNTDLYSYIPNPGATGTDSFTYSVSDGQVSSDIAKVTIQIQEVNVVTTDTAESGGSLNWLFIVLLSLLSGLRFIPVCNVLNRSASTGVNS
jgi:VCBS repeat-containing protein